MNLLVQPQQTHSMAFPKHYSECTVLNVWPGQCICQNKCGSEETSPKTNDLIEFISSNHFSNSTEWTGQPINQFKTGSETFEDNKLRIMSHYHTSARDKTVGKAQQTNLNSICISLPKNVNIFNDLLFTSLHHCLHLHGMEDKIIEVKSLCWWFFFCVDLCLWDLLVAISHVYMTTTTETRKKKYCWSQIGQKGSRTVDNSRCSDPV